jgi:hypothetical protein
MAIETAFKISKVAQKTNQIKVELRLWEQNWKRKHLSTTVKQLKRFHETIERSDA